MLPIDINDKLPYFSPTIISSEFHLCSQVDKDCDFLEQERIMDYSMLVGLHFRETSQQESVTPNGHQSGNCTPVGQFLSYIYLSFHSSSHSLPPNGYVILSFNLFHRKWRP